MRMPRKNDDDEDDEEDFEVEELRNPTMVVT